MLRNSLMHHPYSGSSEADTYLSVWCCRRNLWPRGTHNTSLARIFREAPAPPSWGSSGAQSSYRYTSCAYSSESVTRTDIRRGSPSQSSRRWCLLNSSRHSKCQANNLSELSPRWPKDMRSRPRFLQCLCCDSLTNRIGRLGSLPSWSRSAWRPQVRTARLACVTVVINDLFGSAIKPVINKICRRRIRRTDRVTILIKRSLASYVPRSSSPYCH